MADLSTLPDLLASLSGHGVYDIAFVVNELPRYGFVYDETTDILTYQGRTTKLNARSPKQVQAEMDADPKGGVIDLGRGMTGRLVDAIDVSSAILRLIAPNDPIPSQGYYGRGRGYKADVELITRRWRNN